MKYLERVYPWLLGAPVILPVVIWGGLIYPYLVPKTLLFYALILITVAVFGFLVANECTFFWARLNKWETWIPAALLVLAYLSSFFGVDFYRSFWSLFIRGDGLLMLTCAVTSFYLILIYADRKFFDYLLRAVAVIASVVALYGIGEWLIGGGRIGGLLGNAAFFAGYLGISFFATLATAQTLQTVWKRAAITGAMLQIIAAILTATRGTMLALAVTAIAYLIYLAFRKPVSSGWARVVLTGIVIFGGLFFAFRSEIAKVPFAPIARIASISTADNDVASRLFIWKNMMNEIGKAPVLGVGAEHIDILFNRFYDPTQIYEQWFDRSHNAFLDYAAQYGIVGALLYLALISMFFFSKKRSVIFSLLAISYAVQNFFVFDTVSSFWLLLALLAGFLAMSFEDVPRKALSISARGRYASWSLALVLLILIIPVSIRPALAAYDLAQAYRYQLTDVSKEVNYLSRGIALDTYADIEYGYEAYNMYAINQVPVLTGQARIDAYQSALSILIANFRSYAYDARTALYLAHVLSLAPSSVTIDQNLLSSALERAIRLSPRRSQPWYILMNLSISQANTHPAGSQERAAGYVAAQDLLTRYIALVPTLSQPHFVLAQLLFASGKIAEANAEAAKGKLYYQEDLETARRAVSYYETVMDLPSAAFFLDQVVQIDPTDATAKSDLAKIQAYEQSKK